jgi:hypothetical protein
LWGIVVIEYIRIYKVWMSGSCMAEEWFKGEEPWIRIDPNAEPDAHGGDSIDGYYAYFWPSLRGACVDMYRGLVSYFSSKDAGLEDAGRR